MDFFARIVLRLRAEPRFSRNRHFRTLSSPEGRRALRVHRHLHSLERALASGAPAAVAEEDGRIRIELSGDRFRRTAFLSRAEFRLLCQSPGARAALGDRAA